MDKAMHDNTLYWDEDGDTLAISWWQESHKGGMQGKWIKCALSVRQRDGGKGECGAYFRTHEGLASDQWTMGNFADKWYGRMRPGFGKANWKRFEAVLAKVKDGTIKTGNDFHSAMHDGGVQYWTLN